MFKWLGVDGNVIDRHTPQIKAMEDLYTKWGGLRDARLRWLEDNGEFDPSDNGQSSDVTAMDVFQQLQAAGCSLNYDQGDVDMAAGMFGLPDGSFSVKDMPK